MKETPEDLKKSFDAYKAGNPKPKYINLNFRTGTIGVNEQAAIALLKNYGDANVLKGHVGTHHADTVNAVLQKTIEVMPGAGSTMDYQLENFWIKNEAGRNDVHLDLQALVDQIKTQIANSDHKTINADGRLQGIFNLLEQEGLIQNKLSSESNPQPEESGPLI